ncbi:MAG: TRAP transporter small permease subunit [Myxococcota bacterium]
MHRLIDGITHWNVGVGHVVRWLLVIMVGIGSANAILRYASTSLGANLSSNGLIELQWYLFAAVFLLGAPYTLIRNRHVRVDVFYGRLSGRQQAWVDLGGTLGFLLPFSIFGVVTSWPLVRQSFAIGEMSPDPGGLLRWPVKALVPLAFALLALQSLAQLRDAVRRIREEAP